MSNQEAREILHMLDKALKPPYLNAPIRESHRESTVRNRRNDYDLRTQL